MTTDRVRALILAVILLLTGLPRATSAQANSLRLLGEFSFPSQTEFAGTVVGGLSGIAYDARGGVYYAVSDDRGEFQPPRFYTLEIDFGLTGIRDVRIVAVTTLDSDAATPGIQPYERNGSDLEEIVLLPSGELLISSERDRDGRPWVRRFALDGVLLGELPIPDKFLPQLEKDQEGRDVVVRGVRTNLGFEGMALADDGATLYVANEEAIGQDGPIATLAAGTNVRFVRYDLAAGAGAERPGPEYVYPTEPVFAEPNPATAFADNGVTAISWIRPLLPEFDLLVMERSFATGVGNDVSLYGARFADAQDVSGLSDLPTPFAGRTVRKTRLANIAQLGITADNLEGMTLGPRLPSGKASLLVISDDNFSAFDPPQVNQFILFEVDAMIGK